MNLNNLDEILNIQKAAEIIKNSDAILISAGSGLSVDSGLPNFKDNEEFWKLYPSYKKLNLNFINISNPKTFKINPKIAWGYYGHKYNLYKNTNPHHGFDILKDWCKKKPKGYFIFTTNIDGHFQKSGFLTNNIVEIHGNINKVQCRNNCFKPSNLDLEYNFEINSNMLCFDNSMPKCKKCNQILRPNILLFDDWEFDQTEIIKLENNIDNWLLKNRNFKTVLIEIGAGKNISTIRKYNENIIKKNLNSKLIRINPNDCDIPFGHIALKMNAFEAIKAINKKINKK